MINYRVIGWALLSLLMLAVALRFGGYGLGLAAFFKHLAGGS